MSKQYPSVFGEFGKVAVAVVGLCVAVVLLLLGPVGWAVLAVGAVVGVAIRNADWDDGGGPARRNCPECGAPNDPDAATCEYCETPL